MTSAEALQTKALGICRSESDLREIVEQLVCQHLTRRHRKEEEESTRDNHAEHISEVRSDQELAEAGRTVAGFLQ